jgi:hypothetical protein
MLQPPHAPAYHDSLQAQLQAPLRHAPAPTSVEHQGNFLHAPDAYVYSSTHVAMPKTADEQAIVTNHQPDLLQYEPDQQFYWAE